MSRLGRWLAGAMDPVRFATSLGMQADGWQANTLRSNGSGLLLNCHRQAGKSTIAAVAAVHRAVHTPKSLVLIVSPTLRQSGELLRLVVAFYRTLGKPIEPGAENALSLILQVALSTRRLHAVPDLPLAGELDRELGSFGHKMGATGRPKYEGKAAHDDLVLAFCLALWGVEGGSSVGATFKEFMVRSAARRRRYLDDPTYERR